MLGLPRHKLPLVNDTHASDYRVDAALFYVFLDGERLPIGFQSRLFNSYKMSYFVAEKGISAVHWENQTFRRFIQGTHFTVFSNQASLKSLLEISELNGRLMSWQMHFGDSLMIPGTKNGFLRPSWTLCFVSGH